MLSGSPYATIAISSVEEIQKQEKDNEKKRNNDHLGSRRRLWSAHFTLDILYLVRYELGSEKLLLVFCCCGVPPFAVVAIVGNDRSHHRWQVKVVSSSINSNNSIHFIVHLTIPPYIVCQIMSKIRTKVDLDMTSSRGNHNNNHTKYRDCHFDVEGAFVDRGIPRELDILPPRPEMFPLLRACFGGLCPPPEARRRRSQQRQQQPTATAGVKRSLVAASHNGGSGNSTHCSTPTTQASLEYDPLTDDDDTSTMDDYGNSSLPEMSHTSLHEDDDDDDIHSDEDCHMIASGESSTGNNKKDNTFKKAGERDSPHKGFSSSPQKGAREMLAAAADPRTIVHNAAQLFLGVCQLLLSMVIADRALTAARRRYHCHPNSNSNDSRRPRPKKWPGLNKTRWSELMEGDQMGSAGKRVQHQECKENGFSTSVVWNHGW
jgi:hypothetical protein